jgi:DNA polymerase III, alpha subunit
MTCCSASPKGSPISQEKRRRVTPEHRFKSAAEMRALFADLPEAVDNTIVVAQRCAYMPGRASRSCRPSGPKAGSASPRSSAARPCWGWSAGWRL